MLLDQKWDVSETNHHIAFFKGIVMKAGESWLLVKINDIFIFITL